MKYQLHSLALLLIAGLTACGGDSSGFQNSSGENWASEQTTQPAGSTETTVATPLKVAEPNSPFANELISCVEAQQANTACTLNQLPFIYHSNPNPTVNDVMNRVVVSHDWMATRLRQILEDERTSKHLLPLFQSVRAVVISADIRPAYFHAYTGAIYLDPYFFWMTNEEKATIEQQQDPRVNARGQFQFLEMNRFVQNGSDIFVGSLDDTSERNIAQLIPIASALLFHELAHARDTYHSTFLATVSPSDERLSSLFEDHKTNRRHSHLLVDTLALHNETLPAVAEVLFGNETAIAELSALSGAEVGYLLEGDGANALYSYYTGMEDIAMLFEESMMKIAYDIDRDLAFTNNPSVINDCNDLQLEWGVRNRIADANVRTRAKVITKDLLANATANELLVIDEKFQNFGSPTDLPLVNWCDSIRPFSANSARSSWPSLEQIYRQANPSYR